MKVMKGRFQDAASSAELGKLTIISENDGLSPEEYVSRWDEGSEIRFLNWP